MIVIIITTTKSFVNLWYPIKKLLTGNDIVLRKHNIQTPEIDLLTGASHLLTTRIKDVDKKSTKAVWLGKEKRLVKNLQKNLKKLLIFSNTSSLLFT